MTRATALFDLNNKVVVVAGASRGIGLALAEGLGQAGAKVTGFGRTVSSASPHFRYLSCDVREAGSAERLFDELERDAPIDAYLHVAGATMPSQDGLQSAEAFAATIEVNLVSAYRCCAAVGAHMARRQHGSIVTVTSIGSVLGFPNNPGYVAAKGGLRMMSKALALDLGAANVRVNALVPGYIHTAMTAGSFADPALNRERAERTMLGRWGHVDDLLGAAIFLISDASRYVTGTDLFVDGGWTAKGL